MIFVSKFIKERRRKRKSFNFINEIILKLNLYLEKDFCF
uniref:Uncharacterized protein n=1 Tax=viral metagenome TaxID=1070528 RepID=A0A6C0E4L8_9ZZZZ